MRFFKLLAMQVNFLKEVPSFHAIFEHVLYTVCKHLTADSTGVIPIAFSQRMYALSQHPALSMWYDDPDLLRAMIHSENSSDLLVIIYKTNITVNFCMELTAISCFNNKVLCLFAKHKFTKVIYQKQFVASFITITTKEAGDLLKYNFQK